MNSYTWDSRRGPVCNKCGSVMNWNYWGGVGECPECSGQNEAHRQFEEQCKKEEAERKARQFFCNHHWERRSMPGGSWNHCTKCGADKGI